MKKIGIMLSAAAALMMAGCAKDMTETSETGAVGTLYATVEGSDNTTRVGFDREGTFYWSDGDQIGVATNRSSVYFTPLTINSGAGTGSASFSGEVEDSMDGCYAVYPYSLKHYRSSPYIVYTFPSEYTYDKVDTDFFSAEQGYGNSFNAPMWGKIDGNSVRFKHLGGVFCVKIDKMPSESGKVTFSSADKRINGQYPIYLSEQEPKFVVESTSTESLKSVTIGFEGAKVGEPGVFYVPVPTGSYSNVTVSVSGGGNTISIPCGNYTIERAELKALYPAVAAGGAETVDSVEGVRDAISSGTYAVTVSGTIPQDAKIEIPTVSEGSHSHVSVSFEQIPGSLSFTDVSGDNPSVTDLVVAIPYSDPDLGSLIMPNVTIDMPNTTVTLAAAAGKANYNVVEATTAENTLVIDSGVDVFSVLVKKGNVRVNSGATVQNLNNETGSPVYVYKEAGAKLPDNLGEKNFVVVDAALADLKQAAANGGSYTLNSDMDITGANISVPAGKAFTLDLNGHTITADNSVSGRIIVYGSMELADGVGNGKIVAGKDYNSTYSGGLIQVNGEGAKLTMKSGNIYAVRDNAVANGQFAVTVAEGGNFEMTGGTIEAGWYAVSGNGLDKQTSSTIDIKGGTLISTMDYAVYLPHMGVANISGGTINGAAGGVCLQRGTLNVSGDACIKSTDEGDTGDASDGTGGLGNSAIFANAKYGDCDVNISGGTIVADKNAILLGTGTSYNAVINVSGGTFSDPSALAYMTDDADITVRLNADKKLSSTAVVAKGSAVIDLNGHRLTAAATALDYNKRITAIAVKDGAKATVMNGNVGDSVTPLWYGVYAYGTAGVILKNVVFSEMVSYAYNGMGQLAASGCTFHGWLSGWHHGGTFENCTFTIGKEWYPATICYGDTAFTNCGFFKNGTDADTYGDGGNRDEDGYYRCDYVVAGCKPAKSIEFRSCYFIDESLQKRGQITSEDHLYHSCGGWGDGEAADDAVVTVDDTDIITEKTL